MRAIGLLGALSVTCALLCGSTASAAPAPAAIKAIATDDSGVWLATSAGLFHAPNSAPTDWQHRHREKIDGRLDRPIDAVKVFAFAHGEKGEMLTVASEGALWGRKKGKWVKQDCRGDNCPRGITGLSVATGPKTLVAFGDGGIWILRRGGAPPCTPSSQLKGWRWCRLDRNIDVVAVAQDKKRGRIWAMVRPKGSRGVRPELRIYRFDTGTTTVRDLPPKWFPAGGATRNSLMTPDTNGGMWLGGDNSVLWMGVDARVHGEFRVPRPGQTSGAVLPGPGPFTVLAVDTSSDDILVGSRAGVARLSLGRSGGPSISTVLSVEPGARVVAMAPVDPGSEIWVSTPHRLRRVWVDTWSRVLVPGKLDLTPEVTAMTAGGRAKARVVVSVVPGGLRVADWDPHDGRLERWRTPRPPPGRPNLFKVTLRLSSVLPDGSAFVAPSAGLWRLNMKGRTAVEVLAPEIKGKRVSAVEVVGQRLYVGTPRGLFSAAYDFKRGKLPEKFEPVMGFANADVTAIWGVHDRAWVGTSGTDLGGRGALREVGSPVREWCGDKPRQRVVVRSGAGTGPDSFVLATSEGVYDARPYDAAAGPDDGSCADGDLRFQRQATDDTNDAVGVPRNWFRSSVAREATDRSRLVWAGADHGVDLIAFGGAFGSVPQNVVATFESGAFLHANQVSAVATIGTGRKAALLVGTTGGIYAHRPAPVPDTNFKVDLAAPKLCFHRRSCLFPHTTRELKVGLAVNSFGDSDLYQFIVRNGDGEPAITGRELDLKAGEGQTEHLRIRALDPHLNTSKPLGLTLSVRSRSLAQWFSETNAKWVAALLGVALVAAVSGFFVVRTIRRLGRKKLVDVELSLRPSEEGRTVVAFSGSTKETSVRVIDRPCAIELWDRLRSEKSSELVGEVGDVLYDGLFSHTASRALEGEGLGSRDIRLRLRGLDGELDVLPWEALRTASGVLISRARTSTVRDLRPPTHDPSDQKRPDVDAVDFPVRVLVAVAAPNDLAPVVGADEEIGAIKKAAATRYRGRARGSVDVLDHARPDSLRASLGHGYDFVHVIAHGERTGRGSRIWLEDIDGDKVRMESDELADLFAGQERGVRRARLIVLNTCSSADGAEAGPGEAASSLATALVRRANVPAVVGMSMRIRTPAAVAFGSAFYRTLFRHGQVDHAMMVARREVAESDVDWIAPRLYIGSSEPELFGDA